MNPQIYISHANGMRFVEVDRIQPEQYESRHMDDYSLEERLHDWMTRIQYAHKWTVNDAIPLQFESNFGGIQIDVVDCEGNVYLTQAASQKLQNAKLAGFFVYENTISWASFDAGTYFVKLTCGGTTQLISHPQEVFESLPNSLLFQWNNSKFQHDMIYETGITPCARFDNSVLIWDSAGNSRTSYIDQTYNATTLKSTPYRIYNLLIEQREGAPDYVGDMLNYIFSCDNVTIDGKQYAIVDGNIESNLLDNQYQLRGYSVKVQEGLNRFSKIVGVSVDPNKRLLVTHVLDATIYSDIYADAGSNLITIENISE
jgi:hypothetical protein